MKGKVRISVPVTQRDYYLFWRFVPARGKQVACIRAQRSDTEKVVFAMSDTPENRELMHTICEVTRMQIDASHTTPVEIHSPSEAKF